ncbi:MAG TPA: zinc-binding alcohol dehydrogenase family protein [Devosiaceae bacterium]|nr:zinc-binding alcohol dehydrogenase family protein [Devosiaceae bacterium]
MKAFAYEGAHALDAFAITLRDLPEPAIGPKDLLVSVKAFAFNPVDYKIRQSRSAGENGPVILGWDAAGVVEKIGPEVEGFKPGDEVYYAGELGRAGSYAEKQAVDYRLVAPKPKSIGFADAAALPLTALTAYEALLERGISYGKDSHALIIGGAGGVGSIAIQLLKALTPATVIATATRPETVEWARRMGADHVIGRSLREELERIGAPEVDAIFATTHTLDYLPIIPELLRPFGHLMVIDDPETLNIRHFKSKAQSVHWEFMFSKSLHGYRPESQGAMLRHVAELVDAGKVQTTLSQTLAASSDNIRAAHAALEAGAAIGKIAIEWR